MEYIMVKERPSTGDMVAAKERQADGEPGDGKSTARSTLPVGAPPITAMAKTVHPTVHRRHLRTRVDQLMAKIRVGDGVLIAKVDDISMGGFYAPTTKIIPVGAFVELSLLRPGAEEVRVGGVIVDDAARRRGLAVRFEAMTPDASRQIRRIVEDQQDRMEGLNPDRGVERTRLMRAPVDEVTDRDEELASLREKVAALMAENEVLRHDAEARAEAEGMIGRMRLEIERLKSRAGGEVGVDPEVLSDIRRDADIAWTAVARVADAIDKLK